VTLRLIRPRAVSRGDESSFAGDDGTGRIEFRILSDTSGSCLSLSDTLPGDPAGVVDFEDDLDPDGRER
jgi:hypothetical protein